MHPLSTIRDESQRDIEYPAIFRPLLTYWRKLRPNLCGLATIDRKFIREKRKKKRREDIDSKALRQNPTTTTTTNNQQPTTTTPQSQSHLSSLSHLSLISLISHLSHRSFQSHLLCVLATTKLSPENRRESLTKVLLLSLLFFFRYFETEN